MNWTQFFKEYCTLSDENNTPKGTIKEYSTKGRKLNIHWTCNAITGLEFGELKEIIFIQHLRENGKDLLHPIPWVHHITCIDANGNRHLHEMYGDEVFNEFQINIVENDE